MRKKRVMLWLLLCGVCVIGGASYLNKAEPLKAKPATFATKDGTTTDIPVLDPDDPNDPSHNLLLTPNPYFNQWSDDGIPIGWSIPFGGKEVTVAPGSYDPTSFSQYFQQNAFSLSGVGSGYINWQRVEGGGINVLASYNTEGASKYYATAVGVTKSFKNYDPSNGTVFTVIASAQRSHMPDLKAAYKFKGETTWNEAKVNWENADVTMAIDDKLVPGQKLIVLEKTDNYGDMSGQLSLSKKNIDDLKKSGTKGLRFDAKSWANSVQWNKFAVYATNSQLTLTDVAKTKFTLPVGKVFTDVFHKSDFEDLIDSATYTTVDSNNNPVNHEITDLSQLEFQGVVGALPDSSRVSHQEMTLLYHGTVDGIEINGVVTVPVEVTWGDTLALGGGTDYPDNMSSIGFSFFKDTDAEGKESYELIANKGNGTYDTIPVNSAKPDYVYYQVDYFAPPADGNTLNLDQNLDKQDSIKLTAKGSDTPTDLIASWGTDGKQEVELNGVLRVYMSEPTKATDPIKQWLYQNNDPVDALSTFVNKNYVFYQVTENGLEPLYTNQITLKTPAAANQISADKNTPPGALSRLFNTNPDANNNYLTPLQGMLADYALIKWDFQEGTKTQSGASKPVPANLVVQKNDSPYVITIPLKPVVNVTSNTYVPWLPYLNDDGGTTWQNSATETIPGTNAFVLRYSDNETLGKTTVEAHSSGFVETKGSTTNSGDALSYNTATAGDTQWAVISNVGYYNGQKIAVKISLKPEAKGGTQWDTYLGVGKKNFLDVALTYNSKSADVEYEFLAQTDEKYDKDANDGKGNWPAIKLSGFWTFNDLTQSSNVSMPKDQFDHIYSYNRDPGDTQIQLKYAIVDDSFILSSAYNPAIPVSRKEQISATVTYNNLESFKYKVIKNSGNPETTVAVYYSSSFAKIGIPKLEGIEQTFAKVTADQYPDGTGAIAKPINYAFVQMIPYESSEAYRNQPMEWTLPTDSTGDILQSSGWKIFNEEGTDVSDSAKGLFTIDGNTVTAQKENKDLYDHTYVFQRNMVINDANEVKTTDLDNNYLTLTTDEGAAKLTTVDQNGTEVTYDATLKTKVNFAADLPFTYSFFDEDGNGLAPQPTAPENGWTPASATALITQNYKSNGFNAVELVLDVAEKKYGLMGYGISGQDYPVSGDTIDNVKIKYSENPVTLKYQQDYGAGAMPELTVGNSVEFGENTIAKVNDLPQINDWNLKVENAPGMFITAIRDDFTADGGKILGATLTLYADGTPMVIPTDGAAPVTKEIPSDGAWTITSGKTTANDKTAGFKLNVPAGNITAGKQYKSTITFTLTDAPGN